MNPVAAPALGWQFYVRTSSDAPFPAPVSGTPGVGPRCFSWGSDPGSKAPTQPGSDPQQNNRGLPPRAGVGPALSARPGAYFGLAAFTGVNVRSAKS